MVALEKCQQPWFIHAARLHCTLVHIVNIHIGHPHFHTQHINLTSRHKCPLLFIFYGNYILCSGYKIYNIYIRTVVLVQEWKWWRWLNKASSIYILYYKMDLKAKLLGSFSNQSLRNIPVLCKWRIFFLINHKSCYILDNIS